MTQPIDMSHLSNAELRKLAKPVAEKSASMASHNRVTVRSTVLFQSVEEDPTEYPLHFSQFLESKDEAYSRVLTIGKEPTALDLGWVQGGVSLVVIENRTALPTTVKPSPDELASLATKVLHLSYGGPGFLIRPGRGQYVEPETVEGLVLRCLQGEARVRVTVIPK